MIGQNATSMVQSILVCGMIRVYDPITLARGRVPDPPVFSMQHKKTGSGLRTRLAIPLFMDKVISFVNNIIMSV